MPENKRVTDEQRTRMLQREKAYLYTLETDKRHERLFAPYGVTFPIYRTLAYMLIHEEGASPSKVADDLMILRQSMTSILDALEKKKLVQRVPDPADRRKLIVKLLPEGEELAQTLVMEEYAFSQRIREYMGQDDLDEFHRLERRMYEAKVAALNDILSEREKVN